MDNEVMNLKRTRGVKNEITAQGMCNTFKRTKGGEEEDSTRFLRYSTPQELFVCFLGERHLFPSNLMCCVWWCARIPRASCVCPNDVGLPPRYPRYSWAKST